VDTIPCPRILILITTENVARLSGLAFLCAAHRLRMLGAEVKELTAPSAV